MDLILSNALLLTLDPPSVRRGWLGVSGGTIAALGEGAPPPQPAASRTEVLDCEGRILMPGLVLGHTHLYSALAAGMPPPRRPPADFREILELVWWKLDQALDDEAVFMSALAGAARAALCGVTTIIDHHASPRAIAGSLDRVRDALRLVGLRGVLCYEVTDRHGDSGRDAGLEESARFLRSCAENTDGFFAGLAGGHASFTLTDHALAAMAELCDTFGCGAHIHCAEDPVDDAESRRLTGAGALERLDHHGLLRAGTILAHGTHLTRDQIARVRGSGTIIAHNTRSNMNNGVGYADTGAMRTGRMVLGTDGIDGDLFAESATAYFKARDAGSPVTPADVLGWIATSASVASERLGVDLGRLQAGSAADLVLLDYWPAQPVEIGNIAGHWFFGMGSRHVSSVMAGGRWVVRNRMLVPPAARDALARLDSVTRRVWERFGIL